MQLFDVDIYVNEVFVGTRRVMAYDYEHAEELVDKELTIEYVVNDVE